MTAIHAMDVGLIVSRAVVAWRTFVWIQRRHFNSVIVHMVAMRIMQVALMNIVGVAIMPHRCMPTVCAMDVRVFT